MARLSIETILESYFADGVSSFLPHVSINCVVWAYQHPDLRVLVHRLPGQDTWFLPGGYVKKEEDLDAAAYRNLGLSGIDQVFLRQIRTFGDAQRIPRKLGSHAAQIISNPEILKWVAQRFVTVVYYGLVNFERTKIIPGGLAGDQEWIKVNELEKMALDHAGIVFETQKLLRTELLNDPVASHLLPASFTLNELRGLYESILGRKIDRGTFRRKVLQQGIIEKTEKADHGQSSKGRPSYLYRFHPENYLNALKEERKFGF